MPHIEYNEVEYSYDERRGIYDIQHKKGKVKPKTFFKYFALNEYSVDSLTNILFFATHPNLINDPFDCNVNFIKFNTREDVNNLFRDTPIKPLEHFSDEYNACIFAQKGFRALLYRKLGFVSLTENPNNMLMWSHYAQNNGFCVEYDLSNLPFRHFGPFPINYVPSEKFTSIDIGNVGGHLAMLMQSNVKNKCWEYENEWRLLIPHPTGFDLKSFGKLPEAYNFGDEHDRRFKMPLDCLKSVYLGAGLVDNLPNTIISPCEIDLFISKSDYPSHYKILDFLSRIQLTTDLKIFIGTNAFGINLRGNNILSRIEFIQTRIIKFSENQFRLIEIQN